MQQTTLLDPGFEHEKPGVRFRGPSGVRAGLLAGALAVAGLALGLFAGGEALTGRFASLFARGGAETGASSDRNRQLEAMTVDDEAQIVVEGAAAEQRNAAIPVSGLPLEQVRQFILASAKDNYTSALKCMTQAVYYEADSEPLPGRQAVAQVVLNRLRHPDYPKSVCGVVYQGVERRTGCQFSFTCDGSLLRTPGAGRWREAEAVARASLGGFVEPSVGTATHYHADYVLPKWAFQLAKIDQLGRHIFYRFPGKWGRALAFNGRYAGAEHIPVLDYAALRLRADQAGMTPPATLNPLFTPGLTVEPSVSDRHAPGDVGGRLDTTKAWRLNIPDPAQASARYNAAVGGAGSETKPAAAVEAVAVAEVQAARN